MKRRSYSLAILAALSVLLTAVQHGQQPGPGVDKNREIKIGVRLAILRFSIICFSSIP